MISLNQASFPQVLNNHISMQVAASYSGYSLQYLRRLLRNGKLAGIKIGQLWLVEKGNLDIYIEEAESATDKRFGPK
jgi:excisionase family DNA binding protein